MKFNELKKGMQLYRFIYGINPEGRYEFSTYETGYTIYNMTDKTDEFVEINSKYKLAKEQFEEKSFELFTDEIKKELDKLISDNFEKIGYEIIKNENRYINKYMLLGAKKYIEEHLK